MSAARLPDSDGKKRVCVCFNDVNDGNKGKAVIATIGDLVLGIQCEHPLLFILAAVDTIEPYKIYSSKAADRDAVRIWKSIDISFTNNTLTLSSRYKCRPITKIYERAKGLEAWVDIESIELSSDRKSLRIKFK